MSLKMRYIFAVLALAVFSMATNLWEARERVFDIDASLGPLDWVKILWSKIVEGIKWLFGFGASSLTKLAGAIKQWRAMKLKRLSKI
jgi:hypothetical protein